jgi:hypothetical protein
VPPAATAVQVAELPAEILAGETEQDAVSVGTTVIVTEAVPVPTALVQVRVYVEVFVGDTDTGPDVDGSTEPTP